MSTTHDRQRSTISKQPLAHVAPDGRTHSLAEHLQAVARGAAKHAGSFGAAADGEIAGLWHDLGKYAGDFQAKLAAAVIANDAHLERDDEIAAGKRVDHSTAGAFLAASKLGTNALPIAFAIAGHHAGVADWSKLGVRLKERGSIRLDAALAADIPSSLREPGIVLPTRPQPTSARDAQAFHRLDLFTRFIAGSFGSLRELKLERDAGPTRGAQSRAPSGACAS